MSLAAGGGLGVLDALNMGDTGMATLSADHSEPAGGGLGVLELLISEWWPELSFPLVPSPSAPLNLDTFLTDHFERSDGMLKRDAPPNPTVSSVLLLFVFVLSLLSSSFSPPSSALRLPQFTVVTAAIAAASVASDSTDCALSLRFLLRSCTIVI
jgi:hypothetical protein